MKELLVKSNDAGQRLDRFVGKAVPLLPESLLQKYIRDSAALWEGNRDDLPVALVGSIVGTHVGPGAVAVAFFAAEE